MILLRDLRDDQGVRPLVGDDLAPGAQLLFEDRLDAGDLGVGKRPGEDLEFTLLFPGFAQLPPLLGFLGELIDLADADDVSLLDHIQAVDFQEQVERLVPGNLDEIAGDLAADVGIDRDIQPGQLGDGLQHVEQVHVLEIEVVRLARILGPPLFNGLADKGGLLAALIVLHGQIAGGRRCLFLSEKLLLAGRRFGDFP